MTITLPWPDKRLSPNARVHYMALYRAKAKAKDDAWTLTREAYPTKADRDAFAGDAPIPLVITITPPDKRKRDRDNMQYMLKAALDGIALGLDVDDYRFHPTYRFSAPEKPGRIEVYVDSGDIARNIAQSSNHAVNGLPPSNGEAA